MSVSMISTNDYVVSSLAFCLYSSGSNRLLTTLGNFINLKLIGTDHSNMELYSECGSFTGYMYVHFEICCQAPFYLALIAHFLLLQAHVSLAATAPRHVTGNK